MSNFLDTIRMFEIKCNRCKIITVRNKTLRQMKKEKGKHYCINCEGAALEDRLKRCKFYEQGKK